ncbi:hypothetical protein DFH06DRAFT_1333148 [Mycena polygramma]|nr:hypothetical protein DFH06DRAFT_1333148 [Mycena polygramma]
MAPRTVFFRPRPYPYPSVGMDWIPGRLVWRPFHVAHEEIPSVASDERHFQCSDTLESQLLEFYHDIKPLLTVTSFDSATSCTLYAEYIADLKTTKTNNAKIVAFRRQTRVKLIAWFRALPPEIVKLVKVDPALEDGYLVLGLVCAHILSMRSELIELKVWIAVCLELYMYDKKWKDYVEELKSCHPPDHRCNRPVPRIRDVTVDRPDSSTPAETGFSSNFTIYKNTGLRRRRSQRPSLDSGL